MAAIYCFFPSNLRMPSLQGHCRLVWREQRQRQHAAMEEEEPAALQPAVRGSEGAGDAGDGASQPGQPLAGKHWDPSSPLPPTSPPRSPALWHAEGRPAPWGGFRRRCGTHLAWLPTRFHLLSTLLLHPLALGTRPPLLSPTFTIYRVYLMTFQRFMVIKADFLTICLKWYNKTVTRCFMLWSEICKKKVKFSFLK